MQPSYATRQDYAYLLEHDRHLSGEVIQQKIERQEVIVIRWEGRPVGWLRFNYFWDELPFMNMVFVEAPYRGRGYGKALIHFWEEEMHGRKFERVLTSTMSDEEAQHLYRKLGYRDCGALLLPHEALEIIFIKQLI